MCQTNVVIEQDGKEELLFENVTALEVIDSGLTVTTLFEGRQELPGVAIRRIDFDGGKVFLYKTG
ncbi:MAG: CooT family nickel-binding protein [Deltaproteobacteria bacterium]|nr:CooT family nickel-binding protein [Deltaproteobacteria bacterium]MBW2659988.1 CooT family nickel-binding protein [Deltaproteobacteria bacterium]